ncbi:MAG: hypothetical protein HYR70_13465 [Chloroflexi bacterium]|nr:hypothetical protein [Chloroflexota bacterium]MBI3339640.1 hypothetical protein [Chloroflexota bacterium]
MYTYSTPYKSKKSKTKIKVNGRIVGQIVGDEFRKNIHTNWILRTPPAIANDVQALHDAENAGAAYCVFTNTDTGIIYRTTISKIWDMGFPVNRGFGEQIALPLSLWTQTRGPKFTQTQTGPLDYGEPTATNDDEAKPLHIESRAAVGIKYTKGTKTAKQLSLFGGK